MLYSEHFFTMGLEMIKSMTAFARGSSQGDWGQATWELRTVNHRYLDVTTRMPEALRALENKVREIAKEYCERGKLECGLRFQAGPAVDSIISVNDKLVGHLGKACKTISQHVSQAAEIDPTRLLSWPGVLQTTEADMTSVNKEVLDALHAAFKSLIEVRTTEGAKLSAVILSRVACMRDQVAIIKARLPDVMKEVREKILARFDDLKLEVDSQRLEQEMVMLAQKMDVAEELDRLDTHLDEVERVLTKDKVVGRRLDFLMQELNRETNTLGAKSQDSVVTAAMVEMKVLVEQMREQVQNLE